MSAHRPVMLDEALAGIAVHRDGIYVDATFGRGGHSAAILEQLHGTGALHAPDQEPEAAAPAGKIEGRAAGILFDLGVSSPQLDNPARGFSFAQDGALDMRMDPRTGESAAQWLPPAPPDEVGDRAGG